MKDNQWIDKTERLPTAEDADSQGVVLVWHRYQGMMIAGWFRVAEENMFTHWIPAPEPPPGHETLRDLNLLF